MTVPASPPRPDPRPAAAPLPSLGAILAGGASRRFGAAKALAVVGGSTILARTRNALSAAVSHPVLVTHLAEVADGAGIPWRPDATDTGGPLAGVETALGWAEDLGLPGALCVACDLPFLSSPLLRDLVREGLDSGALAVAPESAAPGGIEPLCAWYSTRALSPLQRAIRGGERRITHFLLDLPAARLPLSRVTLHGDPAVLFLNVNTRASWTEAERIAAGAEAAS